MDVFSIQFSKVFPLLIAKAERKGRTREDVFAVTTWMTGYSTGELEALLTGIKTYGEDPLVRDMRILDKLVDDLAKGKSIEKLLSITRKD